MSGLNDKWSRVKEGDDRESGRRVRGGLGESDGQVERWRDDQTDITTGDGARGNVVVKRSVDRGEGRSQRDTYTFVVPPTVAQPEVGDVTRA